MTTQGWLSLGIATGVLVALARNWGAPDAVLLAGVVVAVLARLVTPAEAFSGFANEGVLTIAAMFVVAAGMQETGAIHWIGNRIFGRARTESQALSRMAAWVTTFSAFLNNTPIVAMLLPVVTEWCRKNGVSPSRLLMPLSFLTVLGGVCTLIGTSTNLVVSGLVSRAGAAATDPEVRRQLAPLGLFEITPVGVVCALVGAIYLLFVGRRLLPDRRDLIETLEEQAREYLVEMQIQPHCRLVGDTVESAGLRHLPGLFLIEIEREGRILAPVEPDERLEAHDRLTFTGVVGSIVDLEKIDGLLPVADEQYETRARGRRRMCEAVISPSSPLLGRSIRDADFRALYNAAVVAVHRGGVRLAGRVGDIVLAAGDTLLLQTGPHFSRAHRNNPHFVLVSAVEEFRPTRHHRAPLAIGLLGVLLVLMVADLLPPLSAAMVVALLMLATRCVSTADARAAVNWETLISTAAAMGLGTMLEKTGVAGGAAEALAGGMGQLGPWAVLAAIYGLTMVFTELLSNSAAAAIMFPVALSGAQQLGVSPRPFVVTIMLAASLAFATPIGYQTNLMVYGPGGYRFTDFTRVGLPLNLLMWLTAVLIIPLVWPLAPR